MSDSSRFWVTLIVVVVAIYVALKVLAIVSWLVSLIMPWVILGAIGYVIYMIVGRKSLGGGRRPLP